MHQYIAKWPNNDGHIHWTEEENHTYALCYKRQCEIIQTRACEAFLHGLDALAMPTTRIPQLNDINRTLTATGWSMVPVAGTVQIDRFFSMLAQRQFPVANFIRIPEEIDYLQQPDIFHEFFGHGPLLMHKPYADFMQWYGQMAQKENKAIRQLLSRLFWYTIEFGLIETGEGTRIYGGGILSSTEETKSCLTGPQCKRVAFDLETVLQTPYDYQSIQTQYFVIPGWENLLNIKNTLDSKKLYALINQDTQPTFINC